MKNKFAVVLDCYEGIMKRVADMLSGSISRYLGYEVLPTLTYPSMPADMMKERTVIAVGCADDHPIIRDALALGIIAIPKEDEAYAVYVGKNPFSNEGDIVLIAANDEKGVLNGCADFCNEYLSLFGKDGEFFEADHIEKTLARELSPYYVSTAPEIPTRAIWTWGHVIYDYRGFFENMARLRLNEIVIWNDVCPINAREVVACAHSYGIKVVWGYTWGWDESNKLEDVVASSDDAMISAIKNKAIATYENEYKSCGDGIYFQSFTELRKNTVNGKSVAEVVTRLVNETAGELLSRYPELHVQFGLHATSVNTKTDIIASVDPRVHIVWEDCGAFPFAYTAKEVDGFSETLLFVDKIVNLRGADERFGAVLKGLVCLDWTRFVHFSHTYVLGEYPSDFVRKMAVEKQPIWREVTDGWLKYAEYANRTVKLVAEKVKAPILEMLVEDGCFEEYIPLPVALLAEMMWSSDRPVDLLIERVSKYPTVLL